MNTEKVIFAFFIILAATLNFGFFLGEIHDADHHNVYELFAALVISAIATVMKLGDRTHLGAVLLATSLVADLQLLLAALLWWFARNVNEAGLTEELVASIVSMSGGALLANMISVVLLVVETITVRR